MNQRDFEGEYQNRQSVYAIDNRRHQRHNSIQNLHVEQIRDRFGNMEYQTAVYNQPSTIENSPNTTFQNVIRKGPTFMALRRIFKGWKRGNSIRPHLQNETCCIWLGEFKKGQTFIQLKCGKQHWFHFKCIGKWTMNNTTCPIWRTDYVEVAREENRRSFKTDRLYIHSISNEDSV